MRENKNKSVAQDCDKIPKTPCLRGDRSMIKFCCRVPYVIRLEWDHVFCSSILSQFLIGWWDEQGPGPWIDSEWSESRSVVSDSLPPHGLHSSWNSPGQNTRVGSHSILQEIFPTQGSNPGLLHCRKILYQLSYQGSSQKVEGKNQKGGPKRQKPAGMYGLAFCFCLLSFANHSYFTSPSAPFAG